MSRGRHSLAQSLASLPEADRERLIWSLDPEEARLLLYDWAFWARPEQLPPEGNWLVWLLMAGRGFGKTRTGAEFVRSEVEAGRYGRVALVAQDAGDARDVMIEGQSGIVTVSPNWFRPHYEPSKRRLTWPNGAMATTFAADDPDALRGPEHDLAWCDEVGKWRYAEEAWHNLMLGLRLGEVPRCAVTTTPKAIALLKRILAQPDTVKTTGSTYDNRANLPEAFLRQIADRYEGTHLGRQEIGGELIEDAEHAMWHRAAVEALRVTDFPQLIRVVVAVDPAASASEGSSETGIVAAALGEDGHGYVLDDLSLHGSPSEWGDQAVAGYRKHHADRIVGEANNGGDMVEATIRAVDEDVSFRKVFASRGKRIRAEPVAALYEKGKVHHVGAFPELEDQLCTWEPGDRSPDRLDALVWALTELMLDDEPGQEVYEYEERVEIGPSPF